MHSWFWSSCILRGHCKVWPIVGVTVDTYKAWNCIVGVCKYTEQTHIWGHADIASCPYDIRMQLFAVEIMLTSCGAQDRHWDVPYYPVGQDRPVAGGGGGGGGVICGHPMMSCGTQDRHQDAPDYSQFYLGWTCQNVKGYPLSVPQVTLRPRGCLDKHFNVTSCLHTTWTISGNPRHEWVKQTRRIGFEQLAYTKYAKLCWRWQECYLSLKSKGWQCLDKPYLIAQLPLKQLSAISGME